MTTLEVLGLLYVAQMSLSLIVLIALYWRGEKH